MHLVAESCSNRNCNRPISTKRELCATSSLSTFPVYRQNKRSNACRCLHQLRPAARTPPRAVYESSQLRKQQNGTKRPTTGRHLCLLARRIATGRMTWLDRRRTDRQQTWGRRPTRTERRCSSVAAAKDTSTQRKNIGKLGHDAPQGAVGNPDLSRPTLSQWFISYGS